MTQQDKPNNIQLLIENCEKVKTYTFTSVFEKVRKLQGTKMMIKKHVVYDGKVYTFDFI